MPTPEELQQDADFMKATPADQVGYLSHVDPDFKDAHPDDQAAYLAHVTRQPTGGEQPKQSTLDVANQQYEGSGVVNALGRLGTMIPNMARQAYHAVTDPRTEGEKKLDTTPVLGTAALAGKRMLLDPSQQAYEKIEKMARDREQYFANRGQEDPHPIQAKIAEAGGKAMSMVPMVGPYVMGLGERAGKGDVSGALTETAGMALAPEVIHEAMPGGVLPGAAEAGARPLPTADAAVRMGARGATKMQPVLPTAIGMAAGEAVGHPYWGGIAGRMMLPQAWLDTLLEKGRTFGLDKDEANLVRLGEWLKEKEATAAEAKTAYDAREPGRNKGIPAPKEILDAHEKAQTALQNARAQFDAAKEAFADKKGMPPAGPEVPMGLSHEQELAQMKRTSPTDEELQTRQGKLMSDIEGKVGIEQPKSEPEIPRMVQPEAPKPEVAPIMTAGKPERAPSMAGLKVTPEGKVEDTTAVQTAAKEALGAEKPARMVPATEGVAVPPMKGEYPPERTEITGQKLGIAPPYEGGDVGAKVRGEAPPIPRGERRERTRTPEEEQTTRLFKQARTELGEGASSDDVMGRVDELKAGTPRTVTVNVEGTDRQVSLTPEQSKQWDKAKQKYDKEVSWAERNFANDPQEKSSRLKAAGMKYTAEKRQITGQFTDKETAAAKAKEESNYKGKQVTFQGKNGEVVGTSFGKIRVKMPDGSVVSANPEELIPRTKEVSAAKTKEVPKTEPGLLGTEKEFKAEGRTPEDMTIAENAVNELRNQSLQNLGARFGLSTDVKDYDFSKREALREGGSKHPVDRDKFHKDLMAKLPKDLVNQIVDTAKEWDKANPHTFDPASRSSQWRAERAEAIIKEAMTRYEDALAAKGQAGGVPGETVGTKEGAEKDTEHFKQAQKELPNGTLSEQLKRAQELKEEAKVPSKEGPEKPKEAEGKPADIRTQIGAHNANGGSTFHPEKGNLKGQPYFAVGGEPEFKNPDLKMTVKGGELTAEQLKEFSERPAVKEALAKHPDASIGTWHDTGEDNTVVELVKTPADRDEAIAMGVKNGEKAIYDLREGKEILTGGDQSKIIVEDRAKVQEELAKKGQSGGAPGVAAKEAKLPTGDDLIKKYGKASGEPAQTTFILKDGRGVANTGVDHDVMLGGKATDASPRREQFIQNGNIRVRARSGGKAGREVAISIPDDGITAEQMKYLQKMSPQLRSGVVMMEGSKAGSKYKVLEYGAATNEALEDAVNHITGKAKGKPEVAEKHETYEPKMNVAKMKK